MDLQTDCKPSPPNVVVPAGFEVVSTLTERQVEHLSLLYRDEWWSQERDVAGVQRMLAGTPVVVGIVEAATGDLVGFARVVTDGIYFAMLFDVIVRADHRGRGLGDVLMSAIVDHTGLDHVCALTLQCRDDVVAFYERWGFEVLSTVPSVAGRGTGARMVLRFERASA